MFRFILAVAAIAVLSTTLAAQEAKKQDAPRPAADKPKESPEQKAVRAYLKENLPTGKWEEIKWWPTLPGTAIASDWGGTVTRLKYRAANQFGGMAVYDHVYTFNSKGKMTVHGDDNSPLWGNRDRIFEPKK